MNTSASPHIAIRADASPLVGGGHLVRCIALAQALRQHDVTTELVTCAEAGDTVGIPGGLFDRIVHVDTPWASEAEHAGAVCGLLGSVDMLLVDHYELGAEFESAVRGCTRFVTVIDDAPARGHKADILIDPTYGRKESEYADHAPGAAIMGGSDYALLRQRFAVIRDKTIEERARRGGSIHRILLAFGASPLPEAIASVLQALSAVPQLEITVLTPDAASVQGFVREKRIAEENVLFLSEWERVPDMMADADLCIGGAGGMSWERCALALPSIVVSLADNQDEIARVLEARGAAFALGYGDRDFESRLWSLVQRLIAHPDELLTMSSRAAQICDGKGAKRIADALLKVMQEGRF